MKHLFFSFSIFSLLLLSACNSSKTEQLSAEKTVSNVPVAANQLMVAELSGMVCEKGCGASIRKELKSTGAVAECTFDFKDGRDINSATISFDKNKISPEKITEIISTMNEKQFKVTKSSVSSLDENLVEEENTSHDGNNESSSVEMSGSRFEMPNLLKLFSRLIHQN